MNGLMGFTQREHGSGASSPCSYPATLANRVKKSLSKQQPERSKYSRQLQANIGGDAMKIQIILEVEADDLDWGKSSVIPVGDGFADFNLDTVKYQGEAIDFGRY